MDDYGVISGESITMWRSDVTSRSSSHPPSIQYPDSRIHMPSVIVVSTTYYVVLTPPVDRITIPAATRGKAETTPARSCDGG